MDPKTYEAILADLVYWEFDVTRLKSTPQP